MRNNRTNRHSAINALLSGLVKPTAPKAKEGIVSTAKLTAFVHASAELRTTGEVPEVSGKWLVVKSPFKWGDEGVQDKVAALKAMGYKSAFVKGNRLGVALKDLAA